MEPIPLLLLFSTIFISEVSLSSSADLSRNRSTSSSSRIIGGQDAERHQFPYQVAFKTKLGHFFGGGSLISKDFVLTIEFCIDNDWTMTAYMGMVNLDQNDTDVQIRKVSKIIFHPKFLRGLNYYGIALFKLESPVSFTIAVQPAQLASGKECEALGEATISGWGAVEGDFATNELKFLKLPVLDILECDYRTSKIQNVSCLQPMYHTELCVGGSGTQYKGPGLGDRGDPLYRESTKKLIGVLLGGYSEYFFKRQPPIPVTFLSVCKVRDWIKEETGV